MDCSTKSLKGNAASAYLFPLLRDHSGSALAIVRFLIKSVQILLSRLRRPRWRCNRSKNPNIAVR
jgi:hypothetical protein